MSSLAMSSFVEQQIVLHQFTAKHSVQARAMLGWSQEALARLAGVTVQALQQFESEGDVADDTRLALAFRLEAEGLVFFPGFAPGWGMSVRRFDCTPSEPATPRLLSRLMGSTTAAIDPSTPQPNGA
ncbi:XRE family transcriptional regulator [Pseudomonas sp. BCA14]|uniref:helix-turn-helix transcriptional regulator n=1 Tax=unclassified Pseudomonas TaxID=196821 RepID=UPI00106EBF34|nr:MULTISPECIES: helix-turn-helix transcriptional regulator [unclassified Pseudomonas]TFF06141.1 XRE family transcriptional regulator [Pseudomonas sp. JMN1]TFF08394.1 XRE family transcriptional regulator [Pseudomonas sp. BCA17]TFF23692.1 XRE family transcriptional regulator [Pseudomonas sp. BCA14]TFF27942.1 XRE family transcriptional regulator [Pseudomonas sp. BCA13]